MYALLPNLLRPCLQPTDSPNHTQCGLLRLGTRTRGPPSIRRDQLINQPALNLIQGSALHVLHADHSKVIFISCGPSPSLHATKISHSPPTARNQAASLALTMPPQS